MAIDVAGTTAEELKQTRTVAGLQVPLLTSVMSHDIG